MVRQIRLGVNIDHVATLRNARGGIMPDPVRAAFAVAKAGADGVTAHLREDRRHITDDDIRLISSESGIPLNLEMAATEEMVSVAVRTRPAQACIVPERREELTTEGGLDAIAGLDGGALGSFIQRLAKVEIQVALFLDPVTEQIEAAKELGAHAVELHTGEYCNAPESSQEAELTRLIKAAALVDKLGLECHAGHGITLDNVRPIAKIHEVIELNIGHAIIAEAVFDGLTNAIQRMRMAIDQAQIST